VDAITIETVIARLQSELSGVTRPDTVDTVKTGDPTQPVTGIITTFLATRAVLAQAARLGANLVVTHEPTFYGHLDETRWLEHDPVYLAKRRLIDEHGIVVLRLHDQVHGRNDAILAGFLEALGWQARSLPTAPEICDIPPVPLSALARLLKGTLGSDTVRIAGRADMPVRRVALVLGACGGRTQITMLGRPDIDALVCGEINEWETCEYVRDAVHAGIDKGLLVVGHAASEEAGMSHVAAWLRGLVPGVPVTHVPSGEPLRSV
jgi:putative NIF3 family GTP cyclohydrolase 1 type 2